MLHHLAESRLCGRRLDIAGGLGAAVREHERRFERGYPSQDESMVLSAVSSRSLLRSNGYGVDVRRVHELPEYSPHGTD